VPGDQPVYSICGHHARDGNCRYGASCRHQHVVAVATRTQAHEKQLGVKSMGVLPDGPRILTGSADGTVKVWNVVNLAQPEAAIYSCGGQAPQNVTLQQLQQQQPGAGPVKRIVCANGNILWSADEPLAGEAPGLPAIPVGMVYLLNPTTYATLAVKVRRRPWWPWAGTDGMHEPPA